MSTNVLPIQTRIWVDALARTDSGASMTPKGVRRGRVITSLASTFYPDLIVPTTENATPFVYNTVAGSNFAKAFQPANKFQLVNLFDANEFFQDAIQLVNAPSLELVGRNTVLTTSTAPECLDATNITWARPVKQLPLTWFRDLTSRINRFSSLSLNWDSYRSKPISRAAIRRALDVASALAEIVSCAGEPLSDSPFVAPMSSGGVLFEIKNGVRELHIEIAPEDSDRYQVYAMSSELADEGPEEGTLVSKSRLPEVLSWIVNAR